MSDELPEYKYKNKWDEPYELWKAKPTPESLNKVVDAFSNDIGFAVNRAGGVSDPLLKAKAKVFVANAIKSYDPNNPGGMRTWVAQNLQQINRFKRTNSGVLKVPERTQLDNWTLEQASREFEDKYGREPDTLELSDKTGIPVKRINKVREQTLKSVSDAATEGLNVQSTTTYDDEALDYVYHNPELTHVDRRILELKLGYGGNKPIDSPKEIADKLGISPVELTRRSQKLTNQLQEVLDTMEGDE